jgi:serine/threonine protein kinase
MAAAEAPVIIQGPSGKISFNRTDFIGKGSYGQVYRGKFVPTGSDVAIDVAVKRILRTTAESNFEQIIMEHVETHPNVLCYYCVETDLDFMYNNYIVLKEFTSLQKLGGR